MSFYDNSAVTTRPGEVVDTRGVFGQVMGLVAFTVAFMAAGAYLGRNLSGASFLIFFLVGFGCIIGCGYAARRSEQLGIALLFAGGLTLGLAIAPVVATYAERDPGVVWQAAGGTALFVGGFGAYGYATRRDLSGWARTLFWSLLALIVFGLIAMLVAIPHANLIYAVLGLGIFAAYTMFDFNRLRRAGIDSAVPLAARIFLDVLNVFQLMLMLLGGGSRR